MYERKEEIPMREKNEKAINSPHRVKMPSSVCEDVRAYNIMNPPSANQEKRHHRSVSV